MFIEKLERTFFYLLIFFLPTQFGKHFWPEFSVVSGIRVDYLSLTIYFTDVLVGLLFVAWILKKTKSAKSKAQNKNSKLKALNFKMFFYFFRFTFFATLIFLLLINIFISQNIANGFYHLFKLLEFSFIGLYIAFYVNNLKKLQTVILLLAISTIGQSILAISQFINQASIGGLLYFLGERSFNSSTPGIANASINGELILRPYATFSHPNVLAGFLLWVMILCLGFFKTFKKNWHKLITILCLFLGTASLVLTMSRVAILLWLIILMAMLFYRFTLSTRKRIILILVSTVLLFSAISITPFGSRLLSTRLTEESVVQRQELINSSFKLFSQGPVVGIGLGNFLPSLPTVQKPLSPTFYLQPVHNIFLLILTETGIIGFGFFVWFLVKTYKYLLINLKTHSVILVLLTSVLVLGLFDHYFLTLQQGQLLFTLALGICWSRFAHRA